MSVQLHVWPVRKSGQKRAADTGPDVGPPAKKFSITVKTILKWILEKDKAFNMVTWLIINKFNQKNMPIRLCSVCIEFEKSYKVL